MNVNIYNKLCIVKVDLICVQDSGTTIVRFTNISCPKEVAHLCKEKVSGSKPQAHSKEQPTVECHGHKHEEVASANLDNMKEGLQNVHAKFQWAALYTVNR